MNDSIFIYLANSRESRILLGLWKEKVVSVHTAGMGIPADIASEHGTYWKRYFDRHDYIFQYYPDGIYSATGKKSLVRSQMIMAYDRSVLQIKDWNILFPTSDNETSAIISLQNRMKELMASICKRYNLQISCELEETLSGIPVKDIVKISSSRGRDINNFGHLIEENWQNELSDGLKAYLLYLLAVGYRQNDELDKAMNIFKVLASARSLISDLYRGKINFHLGSLSEIMNSPADAIDYYKQCLLHAPFNSKASERIRDLLGH
jgi:hypothetical protein